MAERGQLYYTMAGKYQLRSTSKLQLPLRGTGQNSEHWASTGTLGHWDTGTMGHWGAIEGHWCYIHVGSGARVLALEDAGVKINCSLSTRVVGWWAAISTGHGQKWVLRTSIDDSVNRG